MSPLPEAAEEIDEGALGQLAVASLGEVGRVHSEKLAAAISEAPREPAACEMVIDVDTDVGHAGIYADRPDRRSPVGMRDAPQARVGRFRAA